MSYILRRAVVNAHPLRSIQCTRIITPIVMQSVFPQSRRNYAAHQAEESYDAFNERYISTSLLQLVCLMKFAQLAEY